MRGRAQLVNCTSCGRRVPRGKAVTYMKSVVYSTDLRTAEDVKFMERHKEYYCPSCGKHRGIYEKKKQMAMRKYNR